MTSILDQSQVEADGRLMRQVAEGDPRAFRQIVDAHLRRIVSFAYRLLSSREEAEEVAQETFLRAWQHAGSYEPQAKLATWLHSIAHNLAVDRLRRRREMTGGDAVDELADAGRPSLHLARKETAEAVQAALSALAPRQRTAITLVHYQGLTNIETAEVMGIGVEAVESLLSRGRRKLRQALSADPKAMLPPTGDPDAT